ncbi:hypothetical protein GH714_007145 [Hevea brasiliensis]|uniref:Protein kinase domain-containing protein n=1 Tax=Hevea brasiliensis TaxID=3981 RepID=A0A6A6MCQ1_HEVBR|nr:hypothetical protein GH714_007145 [Hevea brasiliensis]
MGNCFGSPVNNHNSPATTNHSTPETSGNNNSKQPGIPSSRTNNNSPENGGSNNKNQTTTMAMTTSTHSGKIITPNLKIFTLAELKSATRNFRPDTFLGEGGFGRVFKGWIDEKTYAPSKVGVGIAVAVKKSNSDSHQGLEEWQSEVKFLGKFSHPNLVKLLEGAEPLTWDLRLKVAIGAAQGLAFLHNSEKSVIYRDFKTSNILLDEDYNGKLSDFGLAKLGPVNGNSHVTTRVMGTYGYAAPEYVATGHLYVKSDVYGFGVVLLELLTGLRALDTNRPTGEYNLVDWALPSLSDKRKLKKIMDPRLEEQYPMKGAMQAADLITHCLESDPKIRPSMDEVLDSLEKIYAIKDKPKQSKVKTKKQGNNINWRQEQHSAHPLRSPLHSKHGGYGNGGSAYPASVRST